MTVLVQVNFSSNTKRIIATLVEGIKFYEEDYKRPNATSSEWLLEVKTEVSPDNIVNVTCVATGLPLQDSGAKITITTEDNKKIVENIDNPLFKIKHGILLFNKEIKLK